MTEPRDSQGPREDRPERRERDDAPDLPRVVPPRNARERGGPSDPKKEPPRYGRATKTMAFWAVLILLFLVVFHTVYNDSAQEVLIVYTEFPSPYECPPSHPFVL